MPAVRDYANTNSAIHNPSEGRIGLGNGNGEQDSRYGRSSMAMSGTPAMLAGIQRGTTGLADATTRAGTEYDGGQTLGRPNDDRPRKKGFLGFLCC